MRILLSLVVLFLTLSCGRDDKFLETPSYFQKPRYAKTYKLDTSSAQSFAVDVDILWIIDNSGSMDPYQQAVIRNSASFIQQFSTNSKLHWKMGLVSTTLWEPPYLGFDAVVDWQTPDVITKFNLAVGRLGTSGDGVAERTFDPVQKVLRNYPTWHRPGAYLIAISVTDELEQSNMSVQDFLNVISGVVGGDMTHSLHYGVYGPKSNDFSNQKNNEVVQATNGKVYQIDAPDYGVLLADLGKDLVKKILVIHPIIILDQRPVPGTIQVIYRGKVLMPGRDWIYNPQYNFVQIQNTKLIDTKFLDIDISFEPE
jgi:hypothetical protein